MVAVHANPRHALAKHPQGAIGLIPGIGVAGDAHAGQTVQHRSRKRWRPQDPNLRQVHLIGEELLAELAARGLPVAAGQMGENVTTSGVDLLGLPAGARLRLGGQAEVELTGLRNPCVQLDRFRDGLMEATLARGPEGELVRRAGVMAVVLEGGEVRPGDPVAIELPPAPHRPLGPV